MKNVKQSDEVREEYVRSDFPAGLVRGKYAKQVQRACKMVLRPEVAEAFPTDEAINNALLSLIELAKRSVKPTQ